LGGYKIVHPRLTKDCRGCVPGIPGGVDAYASGAHCAEVVEDVVAKKFTFTISSPDEFLVDYCSNGYSKTTN